MKYGILSSIPLFFLLFLSYSLGNFFLGIVLGLMGIIGIIKNRRLFAFISCLGWIGLILYVLMKKEANIVCAIVYILLVVFFWEMMEVQRLHTICGNDEVPYRKTRKTIINLVFIFIFTISAHYAFSYLSLGSHFFATILLSGTLLLTLYYAVIKDL